MLIKEYEKFDKLNDEMIEKLRFYFMKKWDIFMRGWIKWDYKHIINWINYLCIENKISLSSSCNLSEIEQELKKCGFNGAWFGSIDKNELKLVGFNVLNDRQQIYDRIHELISKYSKYSIYECIEGKADSDNILFDNPKRDGFIEQNGIQIPKQFLCPITKKIMIEPVQIFDDITYEKKEIIKYLEQYNQSPITKEIVNDNELVILPNRKLHQKIQTFLRVNPQLRDWGYENDMNYTS